MCNMWTNSQCSVFLLQYIKHLTLFNVFFFLVFQSPFFLPSVFLCVSLGDGKDIESSARLCLPSCPCAIGLRQRPDGHEERVLH